MRIPQTRFKLTLLTMAIIVGGAVAKTVVNSFPLTEMYAALGGAAGMYMGAKTTNNIKDKKYEQVS